MPKVTKNEHQSISKFRSRLSGCWLTVRKNLFLMVHVIHICITYFIFHMSVDALNSKTLLNQQVYVRFVLNLFQVESALMFDSVYVFVAGLTAFGQKHTLRPANLSCDLEKPWQDGLQLHNHISSVSMKWYAKRYKAALKLN